MRGKQKIAQGRGPSNMNLGIFVCSFCSINFGPIQKTSHRIFFFFVLIGQGTFLSDLEILEALIMSHIVLFYLCFFHLRAQNSLLHILGSLNFQFSMKDLHHLGVQLIIFHPQIGLWVKSSK